MYLGKAEIIVGSLPGGGGGYTLAFALQVCAAPKRLAFAPFNWSENVYGLHLFWSEFGYGFSGNTGVHERVCCFNFK